MHNLPKPMQSFQDHLTNCISRCKTYKDELNDLKQTILEQGRMYDELASLGELFMLTPMEIADEGIKNKLYDLYDNHMVKCDHSGREIYNQIKLSANGLCPFCSIRTVSTLDHYLPRSAREGFPEFSIMPINLVPSCGDCNHTKLVNMSTSAETQLIHPYYDLLRNERWLYAEVNYEINDQPTICFNTTPPEQWNEILKARINYHFTELHLGELYSFQAGNELANKSYRITNIRNESGIEGVKEYLLDEAATYEQRNRNSWQTAMYYALSNDNRFLEQNFDNSL